MLCCLLSPDSELTLKAEHLGDWKMGALGVEAELWPLSTEPDILCSPGLGCCVSASSDSHHRRSGVRRGNQGSEEVAGLPRIAQLGGGQVGSASVLMYMTAAGVRAGTQWALNECYFCVPLCTSCLPPGVSLSPGGLLSAEVLPLLLGPADIGWGWEQHWLCTGGGGHPHFWNLETRVAGGIWLKPSLCVSVSFGSEGAWLL